jgi:hypothetical protein
MKETIFIRQINTNRRRAQTQPDSSTRLLLWLLTLLSHCHRPKPLLTLTTLYCGDDAVVHPETLKEEKMELTKFKYDNSIYQSNVRAEDGLQQTSRWNALYEGVLIPVGSVFAVFLAVLGVMLISH